MVIFLLGPTAVGKSEVALQLAEETGGAILSLDSMQVYRGLDIGTGKPTPAEQARVPHGGIDLAPWWERLDTARYLEAARAFIEAWKPGPGRPLYVVGGTGLYFRALTEGLCEAPAASAELREELRSLPLATLQERLRRLDPDSEPGFDWQNPRRVQRALEVIESTGIPLRQWQAQTTTPPLIPEFRAFLFLRDRDDLRERIAGRVDAMLEKGWIDEVRMRRTERNSNDLRNCAALGYDLLAEWIEAGEKKAQFPAIRQKIIDRTRQYAKRQLTWFKRETKLEVLSIPAEESSLSTRMRLRALVASP